FPLQKRFRSLPLLGGSRWPLRRRLLQHPWSSQLLERPRTRPAAPSFTEPLLNLSPARSTPVQRTAAPNRPTRRPRAVPDPAPMPPAPTAGPTHGLPRIPAVAPEPGCACRLRPVLTAAAFPPFPPRPTRGPDPHPLPPRPAVSILLPGAGPRRAL